MKRIFIALTAAFFSLLSLGCNRPKNSQNLLLAIGALANGRSAQPTPSLQFRVASLPETAKPGNSLQTGIEILSVGASRSESVYLSPDSRVDTSDFRIGTASIDSGTTSVSLQLPCNASPGAYYVGFLESGVVSETVVTVLRAGPCVAVSYDVGNIPENALAGGSYTLNVSVSGPGEKAITDTLYLSTDATITVADTRVADVTLEKEPVIQSLTVTLPMGAVGTYYLGFAGNGDASSNTVAIALPPLAPVNIEGTAFFEKPGIVTADNTLALSSLSFHAAQFVSVELLDADSTVVAQTWTDEHGQFSLIGEIHGYYKLRMIAKMQGPDPCPSVEVTNGAPGTEAGAIHAVESPFLSGNCTGTCKPLVTATDASRGAGSFALLETIRRGMEGVVSTGYAAALPPLRLKWAPDSSDGTYFARSESICGTGSTNCIVVRGDRSSDSDDNDDHVIAHEFMHYIHAALARSDSLGGYHGPDDLLEPRTAFSEGLANAFSGIFLNDPIYVDTASGGGFSMNLETGSHTLKGFFSEASIQTAIFDLYDGNNEGADALSLGIAPLLKALIDLKSTEDLIWIHQFADQLRTNRPSDAEAINAILAMETIKASPAEEGSVTASVPRWLNDLHIYHDCPGGTTGFSYNPVIRSAAGTGPSVFPATDLIGSQWCGMVLPAANKLFGSHFISVVPAQGGSMWLSIGMDTESISSSGTGRPTLYVFDRGTVIGVCFANPGYERNLCKVTVEAGRKYMVELRYREACLMEPYCWRAALTRADLRIDTPYTDASTGSYPAGGNGRYLFKTSVGYTGNFGGAQAADEICMTNLPASLRGTGQYKAVLYDANARVATTKGNCMPGCEGRIGWVLLPNMDYYRPDGTTLIGSTDANALLKFPLANRIDTTNLSSWTGIYFSQESWYTSNDWTGGSNCSNWTSHASVWDPGATASPFSQTSSAMGGQTGDCGYREALLCAQQ